ncbi:acyl-CoA Delta(11) desaturase-like [Belonocnema kinseyi]|uniref:acyl-CoA Delta(11) desaturase-like n=1 Tax=Belonocnema kinseyi TaxID=2817044 RepID=UPI00143D0225|nr:acyl-CoA Delta(11) desaturase-like [Belonocnema kinseyi]
MKMLREYITRSELRWRNIVIIVTWHVIGIYGYFTFPYLERKMTFLWFVFTFVLYSMGLSCGGHRLWAHRSFKAKVPLRLILAFLFYGSGMYTISQWVRIHRVHHKYSETEADPHNSTRGFFYSHMGWALTKPSEECLKRLREIDVSDLKTDPIIRFGDKHFIVMMLLSSFFIPTIVPIYFWNESWYWAIMSQVFMRYILIVNAAASVNSIVHRWGTKPYDRNIYPVDSNLANWISLGEGSHNYHHTFPWDYKGAEFGKRQVNLPTFIIEQCAKIGWAYDLKEPSEKLIRMTYHNRGDGSHPKLRG